MSEACSTRERNDKCSQNFSQKIWTEETIYETGVDGSRHKVVTWEWQEFDVASLI
jgi:hypothetical protein